MYLSKIIVSWQNARNPYDIHKVLWKMFPGRPDDCRDFLFRIERQQKDLGTDILMQSAQSPNQGSRTSLITALREYPLSIKKGYRLRFRLRANPTKKINDEKGRLDPRGRIKKCRIPLIREEDQQAWLQRKFALVCSIEMLNIQMEAPLYFRKKKEQRAGKIQPVLFDGILHVNAPDSLVDKIAKGIGPAKAFGCGLLSIAPA